MSTPITGILEAINSKRDVYGNCYWAFRYTDIATGKMVEATSTGGEGNINGIRFNMGVEKGWDAGITTRSTELKIRKFNSLTKKWPHAGCSPEDLAAFIKSRLAA